MAKKKDRQQSQKRRQQRALKERRREKAKKRRGAQVVRLSDEMRELRRARAYPIFECLIAKGWREMGLAHVIITRKQTDTLVLFGVYLVDMQCLGIKNTFCEVNQSLSHYVEMKARVSEFEGFEPCSAELAHQIIYGALDYAAGLGFRPQKDFAMSRWVLDPRETIPPNDELEFGKDGMPLFVSGPHDNVAAIMAHLEKRVGKGNFHFLVGGPVSGGFDVPDDDEYWDEDIE